jgi:hypothetical protein
MQLSSDGKSWIRPMNRRQVIAAGAASIPVMTTGPPAACWNRRDDRRCGQRLRGRKTPEARCARDADKLEWLQRVRP